MQKFNKLLLSPDGDGGGGSAVATPASEGATPTVETPTAETPTTETPVVEGDETESDSSVSLDDFLGAKERPKSTDELGTKKPVVDKGTPAIIPSKEAGATPSTTPTKKFPAARDYTGIAEADVPLFQRMSNEAFEKFRPVYVEYQQQKTKIAELEQAVQAKGTDGSLPPSYYEHPSAYVLTPEYSQAVANANEATAVLEHWKAQLDGVRNGEVEYTTLVRDPQSGQIVYGQKVPVDNRTLSSLENLFFNANSQAAQFQQKVSGVRDAFQQSHKAAVNDLSTYEKQFFSPYEQKDHPLNAAIQDTLKNMHPSFKSNPMAPFVAKSIVTINALLQLLKQQGSVPQKDAIAKKVAAAQKKAGPLATGAAEVPTTDKDEVTMDDFEKAKEI